MRLGTRNARYLMQRRQMHFWNHSTTVRCDGLDPMANMTVSKLSPRVWNLTVSSPVFTLIPPYSVSLLNTTALTASSWSPADTSPVAAEAPPADGRGGLGRG